MSIYRTLARRELWEHRWMWLAPLVVAGVFFVLTLLGVAAAANSPEFHVPRGWGMGDAPRFPVMHLGLITLASQIFFISGVMAVFYLMDCLYAERKDRSILFWKSLPVSDFQTVITKFGLALLIPPLSAFVVATVLHPVTFAITAAGVPEFIERTGGWNTLAWLRAEGRLLSCLLVSMLWYAPAAGWFMLASVLASRTPAFLAVLPVIGLSICENIFLQSSHVWRFIGRRLMPVLDPVAGLQRPSLWIGLAVAAGMLYIVIRMRRYRDDT